MIKIVVITIFIGTNLLVAQQVSCDDLQEYIEDNGYRKTTLSNFTLNSSWLFKVTAYTYDYNIYVIAQIKPNEFSFNTRSYIFCGIPSQNWHSFQYGGYGDPNSYGERFHKYIFDYQCNCY